VTYDAQRIAAFFDAYGEQAGPGPFTLELARLGAEPGAISCSQHILAVLQKAP